MITFYFIRHGESEMNTTPHLIGGRSNHTPLTSTGTAQAEACGRALHDLGIIPDLVYASPAVRTRQTAELTLKTLQCTLTPRIDPHLQELHQGEWEGKVRAHFYTPTTLAKVAVQGKDFAAPGGESMRQVGERMTDWLNQAARAAHQQTHTSVLVFGHGMAIKCLAGHINQWSHAKIYTTATPNVSLSTFTVEAGEIKVQKVGQVII